MKDCLVQWKGLVQVQKSAHKSNQLRLQDSFTQEDGRAKKEQAYLDAIKWPARELYAYTYVCEW